MNIENKTLQICRLHCWYELSMYLYASRNYTTVLALEEFCPKDTADNQKRKLNFKPLTSDI